MLETLEGDMIGSFLDLKIEEEAEEKEMEKGSWEMCEVIAGD